MVARRMAVWVGLAALAGQSALAEETGGLRDDATAALKKAVAYFRTEVACEGGYLWRYSADLAKREGEGVASATTVWVQPPGTPSVGMAYLEAYEATGDRFFLEAARETATCLVRGQLKSGGWDYRIEFDPRARARYAYRVDDRPGAFNTTNLDDDTTQSALRLLIRVDQALGFTDARIHEAAQYALARLVAAQYPNGAWPQRFRAPPEAARFPVVRADYPDTWPRKFPGRSYEADYTFNDNVIRDMINTMLVAWRVYGDAAYRASALRAGDFILLAQMPDPQPAWAQQYDRAMHPVWARKFEPPAVTGGESFGVMQALLTLVRETGEKKYLEPIPRALDYLERSRLPDGRLARFYELKTNRPLYMTKDYTLTYDDSDVPTHYAFKVPDRTAAVRAEYRQVAAMSAADLAATTRPARPVLSRQLEEEARAAVAALDDRGRWVQDGALGYQPYRGSIIDCQNFVRRVRALSRYLAAAGAGDRP